MEIVIRDRPGFTLICKGSYKSNELDLSVFNLLFIISSGEGSIVVFNANIVREDPLIKVTS